MTQCQRNMYYSNQQFKEEMIMVHSVKTERFFCDICNSAYKTEKQASKCNNMAVEGLPEWAAVGKEVVGFFYCQLCRVGYTVGKIVKISSPSPFDDQFEHTLVQIPGRNNLHVYYIWVVVPCASCKGNLEFRVALPQIDPNKRF